MMIVSYLVKQSDTLYWRVAKFTASAISYVALMMALWLNI